MSPVYIQKSPWYEKMGGFPADLWLSLQEAYLSLSWDRLEYISRYAPHYFPQQLLIFSKHYCSCLLQPPLYYVEAAVNT